MGSGMMLEIDMLRRRRLRRYERRVRRSVIKRRLEDDLKQNQKKLESGGNRSTLEAASAYLRESRSAAAAIGTQQPHGGIIQTVITPPTAGAAISSAGQPAQLHHSVQGAVHPSLFHMNPVSNVTQIPSPSSMQQGFSLPATAPIVAHNGPAATGQVSGNPLPPIEPQKEMTAKQPPSSDATLTATPSGSPKKTIAKQEVDLVSEKLSSTIASGIMGIMSKDLLPIQALPPFSVIGLTDSAGHIIVTENDILCGRGGLTNHHRGNKRFRDIVSLHRADYIQATKVQKPAVSRLIVNAIRNGSPPGRFLKKDNKSGLWFDIGDKRAAEKASQALREKPPEERHQSSSGQVPPPAHPTLVQSAVEISSVVVNDLARGRITTQSNGISAPVLGVVASLPPPPQNHVIPSINPKEQSTAITPQHPQSQTPERTETIIEKEPAPTTKESDENKSNTIKAIVKEETLSSQQEQQLHSKESLQEQDDCRGEKIISV
mmetsp:Transcript_7363/g.9770  ORF Transcript_7363/g.9770 Transcript_7363/m.9770 type:complete len:489 (-) Transcript_7363:120-1586(-)